MRFWLLITLVLRNWFMRIFARPNYAQAKDRVYTAKQHSLAGKLHQVEDFPFIHSPKNI